MGPFIYLLALLVLASANINSTDRIWPKPTSFSSSLHGQKAKISPCEVEYAISSQLTSEPKEILQWYFDRVFKCQLTGSSRAVLRIVIKSAEVLVPTDVYHEKYTL